MVNKFSLFRLVLESDPVSKLVLIILLISSIWSWAIIFERIIFFRGMKAKMGQFDKIFWEAKSLDTLYQFTKGKANNPLAKIFVSAMEECQTLKKSATPSARSGAKERILYAINSAKNSELTKAEKRLPMLAIFGSKAPFVGLLGTVWGIMHSFQSIAASKNTSLAVVAPGIAEALLATAVGLIVSIPAIIAYNFFVAKIGSLESFMQEFMSDLYNLFSRLLDEQGS